MPDIKQHKDLDSFETDFKSPDSKSRRKRLAQDIHKYPGLVSLAIEFSRFSCQSNKLSALYAETLRALDDISTSGIFPKDSIQNIEWKMKEISRQKLVVGRPISIIVLGQNCLAKAQLVNTLFGDTILPLDSPASTIWRMIRFKFSLKKEVLLTFGTSYELIESSPGAAWNSSTSILRPVDLSIGKDELNMSAEDCPVVEHHLNHPILREKVQIILPPNHNKENFIKIIKGLFDSSTPILLYALTDEALEEEEVSELHLVRSLLPNLPTFFINTETEGVIVEEVLKLEAVEDLISYGLIWETDNDDEGGGGGDVLERRRDMKSLRVRSDLISSLDEIHLLKDLVGNYLQSSLLGPANHLHRIHFECLQTFILSAFEMAREMQITPKRLEYARMKETELLQSLMLIAEKKQDEMCGLIQETISERREDILQKAESHQFKDGFLNEWEGPLSGKLVSQCVEEIRELVVIDLNHIISQKLLSSVYTLHDSFLGTLERCIASLERNVRETEEGGCPQEASNSLKQILSAAYKVEVPHHHSSTILRGLYDKMKQIVHSLPWSTVPSINGSWRRDVASSLLTSISQTKLARSLCAQLKERLKTSHEAFISALRSLETLHSERLERTSELGYRIRKVYAPRLARLALETSSLTDRLLYGMPICGKEIGRGQYGVVFSCNEWGGYAPIAIKSVVPMDEKHWNDLAMEFYYMRSIPEHDRIVRVRGSVIDHSYCGGTIPSVLIIMDRLSMDLYCALKLGLSWGTRLQIALDVVEGIRYLHSQGLVHRDIKLKNILLDECHRAKLSDLGFCKPEAMMSGSIVGTPIHMSPELFSGQYDNSVDVYAFGILFWYLCAGKVKLPQAFEHCQDRERLRQSVKKGARPERLPYFDDDCWILMESCWASDPSMRPLLGIVEPKLHSIKSLYDAILRFSEKIKTKHFESNSSEEEEEEETKGLHERRDSPSFEIVSAELARESPITPDDTY